MLNNKRFLVLISGFYILMTCLVVRAFYMQVIKHDFYVKKSENQLVKSIIIYPHRGNIFDRNHVPLALTKTTYSAYIFPAHIKNKPLAAQKLASVLTIPADTILRKLTAGIPFIWIKRKIDTPMYNALQALHIEGLDFIKEEQRIYPNQTLAAHVLGFVGMDNQGLSGLEYLFDNFLKGTPGKIELESDPRGFRVASGYKKTLNPSYDGGHIITTLDSFIQYKTQSHLKAGIEENQALSGVAIVMDPQTGDILAMANYPEFNPNDWVQFTSDQRRNRAVADVYEPGSVFKIVTLSAALESGCVQPNTVIYVPESIELGTRKIREAHPRSPGETDRRTVSEILEKSLNVGTTLLAKQMGEKIFEKTIQVFGFGKKTGIELPGEPRGLVRRRETWAAADIGMISFGQGIAVTPIQMITAGCVIANQGNLIKPRIVQTITYNKNLSVKGIPKTNRGQIISKKTAQEVTEMMIKTVETGTGVTAKIPGFSIAGKTGTAQKPNPTGIGYLPGRYVASFLGFFPAKKPKYVILVVIDSPQKSIYGSSVAAPIFKKIALNIIDHDQLEPDLPITHNIILKP